MSVAIPPVLMCTNDPWYLYYFGVRTIRTSTVLSLTRTRSHSTYVLLQETKDFWRSYEEQPAVSYFRIGVAQHAMDIIFQLWNRHAFVR